MLAGGAYPGNAPACPEPQTLAFVPPGAVLANLAVGIDWAGEGGKEGAWGGGAGGERAGRESLVALGQSGRGEGRKGQGKGCTGREGAGGYGQGWQMGGDRKRGREVEKQGGRGVQAGRVRGVQAVLVKGGGCDAWVKGQA